MPDELIFSLFSEDDLGHVGTLVELAFHVKKLLNIIQDKLILL